MALATAGLRGTDLEIYLDDIMIFAENLEEHGKKFRRLVKRLEKANLSVKPKKCQFLKREAHVLQNANRPKKD